MPLDYRLAMAAPQERFGTLKDIMAIGQLHDQDRQQQQARIDAEEQRQADLIVQQTLQKHADRPEDAILELRQRGFAKPAMALETHLSEIKQKAMAARKTELEAAKLDLENRGVHPDQGIKQIETELKLIAARDPKAVLEGIANSRNQEDLDHWLNAAKIVLPRGSEALIATFPTTWTPEVPQWAAQQAMGAKEVANNALQTRGQDMTAQTAAAGQAVTTRGQDISAATQQRGQNMAAATAAAGQATTRRGQDMTDKRAGADSSTGGAKLSAANIEKVAGVDQSLGMMDDIDKLLPKMTGNIGVMDGRLASAKLATGVGVSQDLATFAAQLSGLKNAVIKATTGAAMSEPEAKRIMGQLPDLTQPETVFKARMETTRKNLELLKKRIIELSGGAVSAPAGPKTMTAEELIKKYGGE